MFAIMNADGQFLPGGGRGGTWREFGEKGKPPRLFNTRTAANNALRWWLYGPGYSPYNEDGDTEFYQNKQMELIGAQRQAIAHTIKVVEVDLVVL